MVNYSEEDLAIFQKINIYIEEGIVTSFEDDLLHFLASYTDLENKKPNYLNALNSNYSIGKCYRFARYLALGMSQPFHLYEGKLGSLYQGKFTHAWIETKDSVYDTSFIGKWPKKLYYQLFQPIVEKDINLESDESYIKYKNNNTEASSKDNFPLLMYVNWYAYMTDASIPNPFGIPVYPCWNYFSQDLKKVERLKLGRLIKKELEFARFIQKEWNEHKINDSDEIPPELFSLELSQYIDTNKFTMWKKEPLYKELIKFIIHNRDLYEEKKEILYDISLRTKAIKENYSGTFCELIFNLPSIIVKLKEKGPCLRKKI